MFCKNCGNNIAEGKSFCTSCGVPVGQASGPVVAAPAVSAPGQPAQSAPPKPKRTGLIVGAAVAAVILVAVAGVGIWLALRADDGGAVSNSATTLVDAAATTETIPSLDVSEGESSTTLSEGLAAGPLAEYRIAVENLLMELDSAHARIPEVADTINSTLPGVPQGVYDELDNMLYTVQTASDALSETTPPPAFEDANDYLAEAASRMIRRIQATMDGVQAAWDSGSKSDALPFFSDGRHQRDAYLSAIQHFREYVPVGTLPGD